MVQSITRTIITPREIMTNLFTLMSIVSTFINIRAKGSIWLCEMIAWIAITPVTSVQFYTNLFTIIYSQGTLINI
uniref:Uncharacterized protein n=1 Tax=Arcella intermedia TaxID=1963864 RepID=A0A6B2LVN1_9EUKA